jgi:hypothetical protein
MPGMSEGLHAKMSALEWRKSRGSTKNQGCITKPKVTFDMLFDKYSKQKAVTSDQPVKKDEITSTSRETSIVSQGSHQVQRWIISEAKTLLQIGLLHFTLSMMIME